MRSVSRSAFQSRALSSRVYACVRVRACVRVVCARARVCMRIISSRKCSSLAPRHDTARHGTALFSPRPTQNSGGADAGTTGESPAPASAVDDEAMPHAAADVTATMEGAEETTTIDTETMAAVTSGARGSGGAAAAEEVGMA